MILRVFSITFSFFTEYKNWKKYAKKRISINAKIKWRNIEGEQRRKKVLEKLSWEKTKGEETFKIPEWGIVVHLTR